jgi:hypothetical protein
MLVWFGAHVAFKSVDFVHLSWVIMFVCLDFRGS